MWVLFTKAGCGRANRGGSWGVCVVELHKDTVLSPHPRVPGAPAPGLSCTPGWQGGGTSLTIHTLPCHCCHWGQITREETDADLHGASPDPLLTLLYLLYSTYLEQQHCTNSPRFTKLLGKATIKDYQTPSLTGERPGAIHF